MSALPPILAIIWVFGWGFYGGWFARDRRLKQSRPSQRKGELSDADGEAINQMITQVRSLSRFVDRAEYRVTSTAIIREREQEDLYLAISTAEVKR